MRLARSAAVVALATTVVAQVDFALKCFDGLYVVAVRGSGEREGYGIVGPVAQGVVDRVPGSVSRWLPYPATFNNYGSSQPAGVANLTSLIKEYVDKCPCHKIALVGLSQGAHVIADTLIGPSYPSGLFAPFGPGIGQKYVDAIGAAVLQGDPSYVAGLPIDTFSNATKGSYFPRNNTDNWSKYGLVGKVQSLCYANDTYCDLGALGAQSSQIHGSYTRTYGNQSADFVAAVWNNSTKNVCATNKTTTPATSNSCGCSAAGNATTGSGSSSSSGNTTAPTNTSTGSGTGTGSTPAASTRPAPASSGVKTGISSALLLAALAFVL